MPLRRPRASLGHVAAFTGYALVALVREHVRRHDEWPIRSWLGHLACAIRWNHVPVEEAAAMVAAAVGVLAAVILAARAAARVSFRASGVDRLDGLRRWVAAKPRTLGLALAAVTALIGAVPALIEATHGSVVLWSEAWATLVGVAMWALLTWVVPVHCLVLAEKLLVRWLVSPLLDPEERAILDAPERGRRADAFVFSAVAATPEARLAVGALAILSLGVSSSILLAPRQAIGQGPTMALVGYIAIAALVAATYARGSRVALGFDGVRIGGTSRTRFFPYRELDGVEERGHDIALLASGQVAVRLQLHGRDAGLRGAVIERLRAAIEAARRPAGGAAKMLAESASPGMLARAARGDGSYRAQAATRDQLWEVVETANADGAARARAAQALSEACGAEDRTRLRAAAERCAEPETRAILERLAEAEAEAEAEAATLTGASSSAPRGTRSAR